MWKGVRTPVNEIRTEYEAALESHLGNPSELSLQRAYELGRKSVAEGLGILEITSLHHEALAAALAQSGKSEDSPHIVASASQFLSECLAPFEMSFRGYREANQRLHELAESRAILLNNLELKNRELESFSYSVSHDLRAPLRTIDGFSRILIDDYSKTLEPEALRLLKLVCDKAAFMSQLIDGLLEFSRLSRTSMRFQLVDMTSLAESAFRELMAGCPQRKVQIDIEPLPSVQGDSFLLRQAVSNLLSNAIKYTRTKDVGRIEVRGWTEEASHIFSFKDNGVGFDMAYKNKLFGIFQRLHRAADFEGTGVGLSIVQRVIERHEGKVWAEGKVGEGATFYFSLPVKTEAVTAA